MHTLSTCDIFVTLLQLIFDAVQRKIVLPRHAPPMRRLRSETPRSAHIKFKFIHQGLQSNFGETHILYLFEGILCFMTERAVFNIGTPLSLTT